jgi:energy-coupling factor transport system permease protein
MRGIGISYKNILLNPISMLEYMLVPLLSCTVKIGDELSAAALSRGLDSTVKRTNICRIEFCAYDFWVITISFVLIILSIFFRKVIV